MVIVKVFGSWMTLTFLIYQVPNLYFYMKSGEPSLICLIIVQWILVIAIIGIAVYSMIINKPELNRIVAILVMIRAYLPLFDIEDRRHSNTELSNAIFLVASTNGLIIQQVINNLIMDKKYMIPNSILTMIICLVGAVRLFNRNDDPFFGFLKANFTTLAPICLG